MSLLTDWRDYAYSKELNSSKEGQVFWSNYFSIERDIYALLLAEPDTAVTGTVKELAEKYNVDVSVMVGFLDGINDSLKTPNPIEEMEEDTVVTGTVKELAEKYDVKLSVMVGFLDGINDSLKTPNPIEEMTEDTVVSLEFDKEKLYYNMVEAKADWLYELPQWDNILTPERRKELYKQQKASGTIVKEKKVGRNDPCSCGSGKKYKFCCGKN